MFLDFGRAAGYHQHARTSLQTRLKRASKSEGMRTGLLFPPLFFFFPTCLEVTIYMEASDTMKAVCVFLPTAGNRLSSSPRMTGHYWSLLVLPWLLPGLLSFWGRSTCSIPLPAPRGGQGESRRTWSYPQPPGALCPVGGSRGAAKSCPLRSQGFLICKCSVKESKQTSPSAGNY